MRSIHPEGIYLGLEDNKSFIIKLLETDASEIPLDSRLFLGAVGPGDTESNPHKLGEKPYSKYSLSYSDQSNNRKKSGLKFRLDLPVGEDEFIWNENETLVVQVRSSAQVDFSTTGCLIETEVNRYLGSPE